MFFFSIPFFSSLPTLNYSCSLIISLCLCHRKKKQVINKEQKIMLKIGFAKNSRGKIWDHKGKTQLVQIFILSDDESIKHLQFVYAENGSFILSERVGDDCIGNKFNTVKLDYPDEFLTSVSGTYSVGVYDTYKLTSISFGTNKCKHGPFGEPGKYSKNFDFQMGQDRAFGGFHGSTTSDRVVESIGVYVKPITTLRNLSP